MSIRKTGAPLEEGRVNAPRRWWVYLLLLSLLLCLVWSSVAVSGNIRLDSDRMLHEKHTALSQYREEGRFGLAFLLEILFPGEWNPWFSGVLFLLFFIASVWVLVISLWQATEGRWPVYCYALFFLLYGTSPVWAFQFYFTLQSAPVAFGMLLSAWTARMDIRLRAEISPSLFFRILWEIAACLILVFLMSVYQSLILCYAAAAVMLLFCRLWDNICITWKTVLFWLGRVVAALLLYILLARTLRGGESPYMMGHIQWRTQPVLTCLENIFLEFGKTIVMVHSGHFSLYLPGLVLLIILLVRRTGDPEKPLSHPGMLIMTGITLMLLPLAISIMQGSRPVPRTQFALQVTSAFLPVFFLGEYRKSSRWLPALCAAVVVLQSVLVVRLAYTDNQRNKQDLETAARISGDIAAQDASGMPLLFLGALPFRDDSLLMEKTDVFGLSFFEWSWQEDSPSSAGVGAVRLLRAVSGEYYCLVLDPGTIDEAYTRSADMPAYPSDGYLLRTDSCLVIKLSE